MKLEIKNITKSYGKKQVLKGVSFSAESGECIGILGGNGCGKSTLLTILAGVQSKNGGEFLCDGNDFFAFSKQRADYVGFVPQGTPLFEELSAYDNLLLWYDKKELKKELESGVLKMLGIDEFLKVRVSSMSGGMKKRLSIGCAISKKPPIILLDEPMSALDIACKQKIYDYLKQHKQKGGIVLLVTHDLLELELCDKCILIKDGKAEPFVYDNNLDELVKNL